MSSAFGIPSTENSAYILQKDGHAIHSNPNETPTSRIQTYTLSQNHSCACIETLIATGEVFCLLQDLCNNDIFTRIDVTDLLKFSQVSKCCYSATKADLVWVRQFKKFFPSIHHLQKDKNCDSPEQQFKVYFNYFKCKLDSYKEIFNQNKKTLNDLLSPNGTMANARKEYENCGGNDAHTRFINAVYSSSFNGEQSMIELWRSSDAKAFEAFEKLKTFTQQLDLLAGSKYDGTDQSIQKNSKQGLLLEKINTTPRDFDDQRHFETVLKNPNLLQRLPRKIKKS